MSSSGQNQISRRQFIAMSSAAAVASSLGLPRLAQANKPKLPRPSSGKPNILFIFTDQEKYFHQLPTSFSLPGHRRLLRTGTSFQNHMISATMCTSSRSVMLTGLQTPDTGMFDNVDMPYVKPLPKSIPTLGHLLRKAGYTTAYKGKWHLSRDFDPAVAEGSQLARIMDEYGFGDFSTPGDMSAHDLGGYQNDVQIGASAVSWLRNQGSDLASKGQPWCLTVSLVNPHDIMYFNADAPGENFQDTGRLLMQAARAPETSWYSNNWRHPLPQNLHQALNEKGRPAAHEEYSKAWAYCLGEIPLKPANWNRFTNFYLNSMRLVDFQIEMLLNEMDHLGLTDNTVVVFTADHGEMGGAHGLRGKGPFAYAESTHVPFYIVHPDVQGGSSCQALTSHIDIVPSLLSLAGVSKDKVTEFAGRSLPGRDLTGTLQRPQGAGLHDVRQQALFTYSGIATNDSEMIRLVAEAKAKGEDPKEAVRRGGYQPNLKKRGSLRCVFDGRYKFTRYFAPTERNSPKNFEDLFAYNDVELFDLQKDPSEMQNLALDPQKNKALILAMNTKLETAIREEIGSDNGREMPDFPKIDWSIDELDL